jgi:hypothetical protein
MDMGLDIRLIADGESQALSTIAALSGASLEDLTSWALRRTRRSFQLRGQELRRSLLRRSRLVVCPSCIAQDMTEDRLEPVLRPARRAYWDVASIRTCPTHARPLVDLDGLDTQYGLHDFTAAIENHIDTVVELAQRAEHQPISSFEAYVFDRLEHGNGQASWLDGLEFHAAVRTCEVLGAVAEHGPHVRIGSLDGEAMRRASEAGYRIAYGGEEAIRGLLSDLQKPFEDSRKEWGPKALFGRLYEWLAHESDEPAFEPLRELILRHVVETMPVGPGDELFGRQMERRRLHSIHSASKEYQLHPKRLRRLLKAAGYLDEKDVRASDERTLFDSESTAPFLRKLSESMSLTQVGVYLNAPRPIPRLLMDRGFIVPFFRSGRADAKDHAFARSDLDEFLRRLFADVDHRRTDLTPIRLAAKRANCSQAEIVDLLLRRKLKKVGQDPAQHGYVSVTVDVGELREHLEGVHHGALTLREVEKRMRWSSPLVAALVEHGFLKSRRVINPKNRCPQTVVDEPDLTDFDEEFVSLYQLARERDLSYRKLEKSLEAKAIGPVFDLGLVPVKFYRRAVVD